MEFHSLSRKQLQALCKKNKIPANITNVAMADALAALHQVEGLDEILNPLEADAQQLQDEMLVGTPAVKSSACRTSTRRKDAGVAATPAVPSSRRGATAISTRRKKEAQMAEDEKNGGKGMPIDALTTPAAPSTRTRAYSTRRSVRLLEKNLSKMSLLDGEDIGLVKIDDISKDMSNISQQMEDSAVTEESSSLQSVSTSVSQKADESEVTSQEKNTECELGTVLEPQDSNLRLEGSLSVASVEVTNQDAADFSLSVEIPDVASMEGNGQDIVSSLPMSSTSNTDNKDGNDSTEIPPFSSEISEDASIEVNDQDVAALAVEVPDDATTEVDDQDVAALVVQDVPDEEATEQDVAALTADVPDDASMEATEEQDVAEDFVCSIPQSNNKGGDDSAEIYALSNDVSEDASMEVSDQGVAASTVEVPDDSSMEATDHDTVGLETMKHKSTASTEISFGNIDEVRLDTTAVAPIYEQKANDIPIHTVGADQFTQSGPKDAADECIQEDGENKKDATKEGIYEQMSMRELKKMIRNLTIDSKSSSKFNNIAKEVARERTALQVLPENQMNE